jgi:hypothetical protein
MIGAAVEHRVQGLLWAAIEAGHVRGDQALMDAAREACLAGLRTCLAAEETAVLAIDALTASSVEVRALKGIAMAHLDHDDPAERMFGDADLLVRAHQLERALDALAAAGFRRAEPAVRGWWERRFGKAVVLHSPVGGELDLHLRITGGYFGERIDHDALWSRPDGPVTLAGRSVFALDREARLLHACCHAVLGGHSGLRAVHDVAHLVLVSGADWRTAVERASRDGADLVVAAGLCTAWDELGLDRAHPAAQWAGEHQAASEQARALAAYRAAIGGEGWAPEGRSILAALGPLDRIRFLAGLAVPSTASLRARHRTWRQHLRSGVSALRGAQ